MASTCKYFEEDAVYRINRKGQIEFGLVLENSEFVSSDEEDEEDKDMTDWDRVKRGHIRVAWHPKGHEKILLEKKVKLFDRSLMPGDIVRKVVKGKDTQLGYCRSTDVKATVQVVGSRDVITNVKSTDLTPLEDFSADIAVFLNSWVGIIKVVKSDITVRSNDGSRCILTDDEALDLDDVLERRDRVSEFRKYSFYPGQLLWGPVHCFDKARWLNSSTEVQQMLHKPSRSLWVTVEEVKVVSIEVQWLCRAYCEGASMAIDVEQPNFVIQGDDLKLLKMMHIFEPCALQTGDRNYYIIKTTDKLISLDDWKKKMSESLGPLFKDFNTQVSATDVVNKEDEKGKTTVKEVNDDKKTKETELHVNGTNGLNESDFEDMDDEESMSDTGSVTSYSTASSSASGGLSLLVGRRNRSNSRKFPSLATKMLKKKKMRKARKKIILESPPTKPGVQVVTETLVTDTKASVVWQDGSVEEDIPSSALYPIHHLDGHEFFPGDFVLENKDIPNTHEYGVVKKVDHTGRTAVVSWLKTYLAGAEPIPVVLKEGEMSVYDIKDHPDFRYRPGSCVIRVANFEDNNPENTAGQVLDIHPNGKVEVYWVSGRNSCCYPQELYRIGEYKNGHYSLFCKESDDLWGDDESVGDGDSWETETDDSLNSDQSEDGEMNEKTKSKLEEKSEENGNPEIKTSSMRPLAVDDDSGLSLKQRLLSKIEKLRAGMARIEEVFVQDPTLQNSALMRKLLEIYKHCRLLDQLLGTFYFHEKHLQGLVDHLRQRGRINSAQHMADQITRLFSSVKLDPSKEPCKEPSTVVTRTRLANALEEHVKGMEALSAAIDPLAKSNDVLLEDDPFFLKEDKPEKCQDKPDLSAAGEAASELGVPLETGNACRNLFQLLKSRLLKAHEDLQTLFGMSLAKANDAMKDASNEDSPKHVVVSVAAATVSETSPTLQAKPETFVLQEGVLSKEEEMKIMLTAGQGIFSQIEAVPDTHKFKLSIFQPNDPKAFFKTVRKEMQILRTSLPEGIVVKAFEDRMDLFSVLIKGSKRTPYEDGIFFFDFQLPNTYPSTPPLCHYVSYCSDRLNPNLYEGGKVCVSLLGTWGGKGTEVWNSLTSNLLQIIVSIQGLILVAEPYYNEAGYERQRGTQQGRENSRMYNEMVLLKLVQSTSKLILNPPEIFKDEIFEHFKCQASNMVNRLEKWLEISESWNEDHPMSPTSPATFRDLHGEVNQDEMPEFPLLPASKGFCLTLRKALACFKEVLTSVHIDPS